MSYKNLELGLRKDSNIKFDDHIVVNPSVPIVYYELYGDRAEYMFNLDNLNSLDKEKEEKRLKQVYKKVFESIKRNIKI